MGMPLAGVWRSSHRSGFSSTKVPCIPVFTGWKRRVGYGRNKADRKTTGERGSIRSLKLAAGSLKPSRTAGASSSASSIAFSGRLDRHAKNSGFIPRMAVHTRTSQRGVPVSSGTGRSGLAGARSVAARSPPDGAAATGLQTDSPKSAERAWRRSRGADEALRSPPTLRFGVDPAIGIGHRYCDASGDQPRHRRPRADEPIDPDDGNRQDDMGRHRFRYAVPSRRPPFRNTFGPMVVCLWSHSAGTACAGIDYGVGSRDAGVA
jgi:hypothetical protein